MNTILYIGLAFILIGFVGFIISIIMESYYDKKLYRQKQLTESFNNADKTNKREYHDTY
jgi:phosphate/sulfate permease